MFTKLFQLKFSITCVLVCLTSVSFAQSADSLSVDVKLHNKDIYFQNSDVFVSVSIANNTPNPIQFKLAENRLFNLDIRVRTMLNQELAMNSYFISQRTGDAVYYRNVTLEPGELLSFVERVNDFVELSDVGSYVLDITFYPELYKGNTENKGIQSNTIMFSLRPGYTTAMQVSQVIDKATSEVLEKLDLAPDQIVKYMLEARQKEQWNRFLLYLNLEGIYKQLPSRARRYNNASEEERVEMLSVFKDAIINGSIDEEIAFVPTTFDIIETNYTPREGRVTVRQTFFRNTFSEVKRYVYFFSRAEYWQVDDYEVFNVGTE